jgi:hypothetical protein
MPEEEKRMTKVIGSMRREKTYPDGSGPKAAVSYDSTYRLGKGDDLKHRYVKIEGIGDGIHIEMDDVDFVIESLREAQRIDEHICDD